MSLDPASSTLAQQLLTLHARERTTLGAVLAFQQLQLRLSTMPEGAYIDCARGLLESNQPKLAFALMQTALPRFPQSADVAYWHACALNFSGEDVQAELELRGLLHRYPLHQAAAFLLAHVMREQGRFSAAAKVIETLCSQTSIDAPSTLAATQILDESGRAAEALAILKQSIRRQPQDAQLQFAAGRLALKLGQFAEARTFLIEALNYAPAPLVGHVVQALSTTMRYEEASHPDFERFETHARNARLTDEVRASALFASGKAYDDIDQPEQAAARWREANALIQKSVAWSAKSWRRFVKARTQARNTIQLPTKYDFIPVFIVGLPRTGTTLVAEILSRHPDVCGRGELTSIEFLARKLSDSGQAQNPAALEHAASIYATQLLRDDAPSKWYVDKQPLNFRYLDLVTTLFPQARIVHCQRDRRDTALSIWSQYFFGPDAGFAYAFDNIAEVAQGCDTLMAHWESALTIPIHTVDYEALTQDPAQTIAALKTYLGLPDFDLLAAQSKQNSVINSASMWQARQPIYGRSVGRWRRYRDAVPELEQYFPH
jgi:tetratricopeptide (TPR) repeat protein